MLSRRSFFKTAVKTAGISLAAAASGSLSTDILAWAEPRRSPQSGGPILLNSNENAYGPFASVLALNNPFQDANRYPDRSHDGLVERIAAYQKIDARRIVLGCGSTEVLRMTASAFTGRGKKLIMAAPTFEAMDRYSRVAGAEVVKVPLAANFSHDVSAMLRAAGTDTGLVYVCNPNNPTGSVTPRRTLENLINELPKNVYVLIDEAYHDFVPVSADYISFLEHPVDEDRVIVARTFSKIYGLAGLRIGYAVTSAKTAKLLREQKLEDSQNIFAIRCALASLDDTAAHQQAAQRNADDRNEFFRQALARKLETIPSWTNFAMINAKRPVRTVIDHFRQNNIAVGRPFPPLDTYVRISLGKPDEMKEFWRAWDLMTAA